MAFLFTVEEFDIGNVFFFLLESNIDTYYKRVLTLSPSLFTTVPKTFLIVLVFFLVGKVCLLLTEYVSNKNFDGFILPRVFILFFYWFIPLEILDIDLLST